MRNKLIYINRVISQLAAMGMRFTIPDLAKASGLTTGNITMIMNNAAETLGEEGFAQGRGVARSLSTLGLKRAALIGAISKLGIGVIPSARLAHLFATEQPYGDVSGDLPANFDRFASKDLRHEIYLSEEFEKQIENSSIEEKDFIFMKALFAKGIKYEKKILHGDLLMEIVDNTLVYMSTANLVGIKILDPHLQATYKIVSWEKGGYPNIIHAWSVTETELTKWQHVRENALTRSTVNVSLAIREAFSELFLK